MSTQVQLHVRTDEMHDEILQSEGYLHGGVAGVFGQLTGPDYFDEMMDLLHESESYIVGNSLDDGVTDVADLFDGVTEVTERDIKQTEAIVEDAAGVEEDVVEWLEGNIGEEVFSVHY